MFVFISRRCQLNYYYSYTTTTIIVCIHCYGRVRAIIFIPPSTRTSVCVCVLMVVPTLLRALVTPVPVPSLYLSCLVLPPLRARARACDWLALCFASGCQWPYLPDGEERGDSGDPARGAQLVRVGFVDLRGRLDPSRATALWQVLR